MDAGRPVDDPGRAVRVPLQRWRGQWAHLPLAFAPLALALPLLLGSTWLERQGWGGAAQAVGMLGGLGFAGGILAMPWIWSRWRDRGALVLAVGAARVTLETADGRRIAEAGRSSDLARFGVFEYHVTHRFAGGWYRAPRLELNLDGRHLAVGGEGVRAPAGHALGALPDYRVTAADWARLEALLGADGR